MNKDEVKALVGRRVSLTLLPAAGERDLVGRVLGTIDAADGLVLVIEPDSAPGTRRSVHSHHLESARTL